MNPVVRELFDLALDQPFETQQRILWEWFVKAEHLEIDEKINLTCQYAAAIGRRLSFQPIVLGDIIQNYYPTLVEKWQNHHMDVYEYSFEQIQI